MIAFLSHSNLDAQLVVVASSNDDTFCNTSCDTLELSGQVFYNGQPQPASSAIWSWTGPNGFTSSIPNPRVPITTLDQAGDYCVTVQILNEESAAECIEIDVIETVNWTCPERVTVTGVDCTTDLVDYNFTVNNINCGVSSDFELILYNGSTNGIIFQQTWTGAPGTYFFGPAADPMMYPAATSVVEDLPFGTHQLINTVYNDADPSKVYAQCITEVRVVESINNVACNDFINITLTNDCEAILTPDMILQGNYCYDNFTMAIEGVDTSNQIMLTEPGEYVVSVTGASGISCWGRILAEDKSRPILDCEDIEVYCSDIDRLDQGSIIYGFGSADLEGFTIDANDTEVLNLDISGVTGTATNIVLTVDIEMPDVSDLELYLTPPSGVNMIELINSSAYSTPCMESNLFLCLFDEAPQPNSVLASPEFCRTTQNAFIGEVRPNQAFSNLYSQASGSALGVWELTVVNKNTGANLKVNYVELRVQTNEGTVMSSTDVIINSGCSVPEFDPPVDVTVGDDCEDGYFNVIERTWTVRNPISGLSATCTQTISLLRWTLDDIIWPKHYNNLQLPSLYCGDLLRPNGNIDGTKVNSDTIPRPSFTGEPTVPFGELCGNFEVTYNDIVFRICGKFSKKILRRWTVLDWCTNEIAEYDQIIKIEDDEPIDMVREDYAEVNPPGYANAEAYIVFTDYFDCEGDWDVVPPVILDPGCDPDLELRVYYLIDDDEDPDLPPVNGEYIDDNVVYDNSGFPIRINNLPSGRRTWIKYEVSDECGNTGEAFAEVDVIDNDKPSPVCIEYTVVALNNAGCAKLHAESLDNGSWDNCGIDTFLIRRANTGGPFTDHIRYCCDNCNLDNDFVDLLVTDINGNTNTCRVEVEIQDNIDAILDDDLVQYTYQFDCEQTVNVGQIIDNTIALFSYEDNCDPNGNGTFDIIVNWTRSDGGSKNDPITQQDCGEGSLIITYELLDECGRPLPNGQDRRNQSIFINNNATDYNVNWPLDPPTYNSCNTAFGLHPDNLPSQFVVDFDDVSTSQCTNLAITWSDLVFENVDNACLKILRTWTVIDWCIAERQGIGVATKTWVQTLKVNDTEAPVWDAPTSVSWDATTSDCRVNVSDTLLIADVFDACTDMFENQQVYTEYRIFYADGTQSNLIINNLDARGLYPYGTSRIEWFAEDHCGNTSTWTTFVTVNDVKAPTPYCLGSVVTATMVEDQPVAIWAIDFDLGGFDNVTGNTNCGNFNNLQIYFIDTINGIPTKVQGLEFDCDDVPNGISQMLTLRVYYEDEAGNVDFCEVILDLQDNVNDVCEDANGSRIAGSIHTEETEPLANVKVDLQSNLNDFDMTTFTDFNGNYAFDALPLNNDYHVSANKNDNPLNGVSTLDLVIIQKHILGIDPFDSPFKLIAADADNTGNVSATDLITIRKLILGIYDEFPNNQKSWRFPEENQNFVDVNRPFPFIENISKYSMNSDYNNQDFMAVKIGDVNGSAIANSINGPTDDENKKTVGFEINESTFERGTPVTVPVYATDIDELIGFQNTFHFNIHGLEFDGITSAALEMDETNLGLYDLDHGIITLSWHDSEAVQIDPSTVLFELNFVAKNNGNLSDHIALSSDVTRAEAYTDDLQILDMRLNVRGEKSSEFVLYQNTPNPFTEATDIRFSLPDESDITFRVYDLNGKEILRETAHYTKGTHTITLNRDELNVTGVMYYTVESVFGVETRKMIQIK